MDCEIAKIEDYSNFDNTGYIIDNTGYTTRRVWGDYNNNYLGLGMSCGYNLKIPAVSGYVYIPGTKFYISLSILGEKAEEINSSWKILSLIENEDTLNESMLRELHELVKGYGYDVNILANIISSVYNEGKYDGQKELQNSLKSLLGV